MWFLFLFLCIPWMCFAFSELNPNYFCRDLNSQPHIDIAQLTGMWFGKEVINHNEERLEEMRPATCPIIQINVDQEPSTTINPLYRNYNYNYNYGQGYGAGYPYLTTEKPPYDRHDTYYDRYEPTIRPLTNREQERRFREKNEFDRKTTYGNYQEAQRNRFGYALPHPYYETKYLRIIWDESGNSKEFHVSYNTSHPGFWKSSGPEFGGAALDPQYSHFAGTIQVIKAVGNHLVLTFCHRMPQKELYSVILSRDIYLPEDDIHSVRSQLHRKSLSIHTRRKLCSSSNQIGLSLLLLFILGLSHMYTLLSSNYEC